jgi:hypothetical protein
LFFSSARAIGNSYLQCAIPAFEGLFPGTHDKIIRKLLFELSTWHGLAKLRLHTETTVCDLENSTTRLGELLRIFQSDVCPAYQTFDLPSEEAARVRRKAAAAKKKGVTIDSKGKGKIQGQGHGNPGNSTSIPTKPMLSEDTRRRYGFMGQLTTIAHN